MNELVFDKNNCPKGWEYSSLGFITKNHDGKRIPVSAKLRENMKGKYPYYGASGIIDYVNKSLFNGNYLLISEDGANLLARSSPIAFIAKREFWVNNHAHVLTTVSNIQLEFVSFFINSINISNWVTGTAQPKLNQTNMNKIPISLPPIPEQKRIVSKIESIFTQIDSARESLKTIKNNLKLQKQSVLKSEFYLSDKKFDYKILNDMCIDIQSGFAQGIKNVENGTIHLRMNNITSNFTMNFQLLRTINASKDQKNKYLIQKNDVIFVNTNSVELIGKSSIFSSDKTCLFSNHLTRLRTDPKFLKPKWLLYYLYFRWIRHDFRLMCSKHVNQASINTSKIKLFQIPVISISEQQLVISKIESIFGRIDAIDKNVNDALVSLDRLKNSVLKQAFEGKLVSQDPNDEPAEILLQKIQQEKQLIQNTKPRKGKKNVK